MRGWGRNCWGALQISGHLDSLVRGLGFRATWPVGRGINWGSEGSVSTFSPEESEEGIPFSQLATWAQAHSPCPSLSSGLRAGNTVGLNS